MNHRILQTAITLQLELFNYNVIHVDTLIIKVFLFFSIENGNILMI